MSAVQKLAHEQFLTLGSEAQQANMLLDERQYAAYIPKCRQVLKKAPVASLFARLAHAHFCVGNKVAAVSVLSARPHVLNLLCA